MDPSLWEIYEAGADSDEIAAIIRLSQPEATPEGVRIIARFGDIATCRIQRRSLLDVRANSEVVSLKALRLLAPDDEVDPELPLEEFAERYAWVDDRRPDGLPYTGRGVILGVVDWGFDFTHPEFRHEDGSTRLLALWDQRGAAKSNNPYGYGVIHTQEEINQALATPDPFAALKYHPADADAGRGAHGTHVLSIAAGNGRGGGPIGIAPEADLVCVHMATIAQQSDAQQSDLDAASSHQKSQKFQKLGDSVSLLEAIDFVSKLAARVSPNGHASNPPAIPQPWVVNLSMGQHGQQHDGSTLAEQALDAVLRMNPGCALSQSNGNYHQRHIHASGQLRPTEERHLVWQVAEADLVPNELEIWYSGRDAMTVEVRSPDGQFVGQAELGQRVPIVLAGERVGTLYNRAREPNTLDNHVQIFLYQTAPAGDWEVIIHAHDVVDGRYHCWIEREPTRPGKQSRFLPQDADPNCTTGTICNGLRTIAVGAYNGHSPDRDVAAFSSAGPTRDGRVKPDVCAPGEYVLAARSTPREQADDPPLHTRMSGTSMASPHVAGTIALMFEAAARPLRIEETRNLLLSSTHKHPEAEDLLNRIGSGYLDIERAVLAARDLTKDALNLKPTVESLTTVVAAHDAVETPAVEVEPMPVAVASQPEAPQTPIAIALEHHPSETENGSSAATTPSISSEEVSSMSDIDMATDIASDVLPAVLEETEQEFADNGSENAAAATIDVAAVAPESELMDSGSDWVSEISPDVAAVETESELAGNVAVMEREPLFEYEVMVSETPSDVSEQEFDAIAHATTIDTTYEINVYDRCDTEAFEQAEAFDQEAFAPAEAFNLETVPPTRTESPHRLVDIANEVLTEPRLARHPRLFLHEVLSRAGIADWLRTIEPARIYDAYVYEANPTLLTRLEELFERVALPFETLRQPLRSGDILFRRADGGFAHVAIVANPERLTLRQLDEQGIMAESRRAGHYVRVVEGGIRPHRQQDNFARLVTEPGDRVPFNHLILRVPSPVPGSHTPPPAAVAWDYLPEISEYLPETSDRRSPDYARWIQQSLNQLINAGLVVDGIVGPRTRAAIRNFQAQHGLTVDGIVGPRTEAAMIAAGAPPPPGATPSPIPVPPVPPVPSIDPNDPRIDVSAKFSLQRLLRNPGTSATASDMVLALNSNRLAGIYGDDLRAAAQLASRLGTTRWQLVETGKEASVISEPENPPTLIFRDRLRNDANGLDLALIDAWTRYRASVPPPVPPVPVPPPPVPPSGGLLNPARWGPILSRRLSPTAVLRTGNTVSFLIDGTDTFRAMVRAIRSARTSEHYIYLLGWILKDDFELIPGDASSTARRLFSDASSRGVQIRVMLWDQPLTQNSAEVRRIHALPTGAAILDDETPNPIQGFGSHHQKVLVVKGSEGLITFCGGIDINSDRIRVTAPGKGEPLHDVHCQIVGPAAFDLLQTFIRRWDHHPDHTSIDATRGRLLGRSEPVPAPITTPATGTSTRSNCSVCIARTFNPVHGTAPRERDIQTLLIEAIRNARRFIYMEDQYLVNPLAATELRSAIPHLEHLTILMPATEITGLSSSNSTGMPCAWKLRREFIARLISGLSPRDLLKVRIFILVTPPPRTPPTLGNHTYVHAKTWVFDDELAVIGSANCNRRGWTHDSEVNAFIFDNTPALPLVSSTPTFAQQLRMQLWAEHLNVSPSAVTDGVTSARLWLSPPAGAHIMPYNPTAGTDSMPDSVCNATLGTIDPVIP